MKKSASWVIVRLSDGEAVMETWNPKIAALANVFSNTNGYKAVPIVEWLSGINQRLKEERQENPMKNFRPPFHVDFHSERGEVSIYVTDADDNEVWYADTDTVNELVEDGFISTKGFAMGRNVRPDVLERSVIDYLRSVGVIQADKPKGRNDISVYEDAQDLYDENPCGHRRNPYNENLDLSRDEVTEVIEVPTSWKENRRGRANLMNLTRHFVNDMKKRDEDFMFEETPTGDAVRMIGFRRRNPVRLAVNNPTFVIAFEVGGRTVFLRSAPIEDGRVSASGLLYVSNKSDAHHFISRERAEQVVNDVSAEAQRDYGFRNMRVIGAWTDHYRASLEKRVDGIPAKTHYVVKIVTKKGEEAWLRVGKGSKFDTDPANARVYRNGDKANEAATKVLNWLKKKAPAKAKAIKTISAEPKK